MWTPRLAQEIADEPPPPPCPAARRHARLDPDGHGLPRREGTPLGLPPHGRGLRPDALAIPHAGRVAGPGDTRARVGLGPRDRRLGPRTIVGDRRCPDRVPLQLLP